MNVLLPFLTTYATYIKNRFIRKTRQTMAAQEQFLLGLLRSHQDTELGQKFGLREIRSIEQFQARVPIWPYSRYEPYTDRIANGEKNILNPDPVVYISLTSGSTGKKKQIPVTRRYQQTLRQADLASLGFAVEELQKQGLQFGKAILTNSLLIQGYTSGGIAYGPVSVGSIRMGRSLFEHSFAHPFVALEIADTLSRHYVCLLFALRQRDLKGMVSNFPMLLLRTCAYLEHHAEDLIADLEAGTIAPWLSIEPEIRKALERRWAPAPQRAAELRQGLQAEGRLIPRVAWPQLNFLATAQGGTSDFYFERFPDYFADTPIFGGVYGSAEATFGVYPKPNQDSSILAIESGFYEFIPQDQWQEAQPKTLLPCEVKPGERYRILVTSYSGLYRYDIGDVIEVRGFYHQAPLLTFRYRQGGLLSSTTEKTTEFHATQVMQLLQQEFQLPLEDFCITLSDQEFPARYLLNIELAASYPLPDPVAFLTRFEQLLQSVNDMYDKARHSQVPPPRLRILAAGSFAIVRQRQVAKGMFDSQLKLPHISEDRQFLSGLVIDQEIELSEEQLTLYGVGV
jgi:hypothetical protein